MDDYDDDGYYDSYWADVKADQMREDFLEDSWDRTYDLLREVGWDDTDEPKLGHIIKAYEKIRRDFIDGNVSPMLKQINKNLDDLAKGRNIINQQQEQQQQKDTIDEPLYF